MLKDLEKMLPYPSDIEKEGMQNIARKNLELRVLCIYFDKLTGEKISNKIPEAQGLFETYLGHRKDIVSSYGMPGKIKAQLYALVLGKTSFTANVIELAKETNGGCEKNLETQEQKAEYFDQTIRANLTEEQENLYRRLPSPVLNGFAAGADLAVYLTSSHLSGYLQFAGQFPERIRQSFHTEDERIRSLIDTLKMWCGNEFFPEEREVMDLIGFYVLKNGYRGIYINVRPNFFAVLCFIDELLACADNSFHFTRRDRIDF